MTKDLLTVMSNVAVGLRIAKFENFAKKIVQIFTNMQVSCTKLHVYELNYVLRNGIFTPRKANSSLNMLIYAWDDFLGC